jgi:hypothetical protein
MDGPLTSPCGDVNGPSIYEGLRKVRAVIVLMADDLVIARFRATGG